MTILIVGGACQGKREYAQKAFGLNEREILPWNEEREGASCIADLHLRVRACLEKGLTQQEVLEKLLPFCRGKIVLCDDIFCGVVPLDAMERQWREVTGRLLCLLAQEADTVIRMQCGLPQAIKGELP
ncbi:MAG TPA: bifunctional adenosylcobinamide kinase/adenosylcobinamide-phosphate guanylyltransferase [Candidatus Faecousia excrementigallinarum]|uniref:Bifunctional adenosylcobinamide kinase/adenosylcobinamide-phosphate guanylyltransferase n=1 Tax=Candidatus Faecousia excrementigallinarum TaxID=2840806 RepID=A0A9D0Z0E7_9FIRM|nr:bifunctional adenosylcobinamide kinase/adenosylcobinamide-phosphate guanylyltransferase [Candidatus Faecousia excrementigallinarum]